MTLEDVRTEIQDIDLQLLRLMKRRLELAKLVGEDKASRNAAVRNIPQENKVIDRYRGFALENGMNPVYAEQVCRVLMQESIEIQAAMPRPSSRIRHIAIIGGYGKMGRWFADLLKDAGHRVDIIDPSSGNGLVIEDRSGRYRATFLPQVWEDLPDPHRFVAHLLVKAGLPASTDWHDGEIRCSRYTVTAYRGRADA